MIGKMSVHFVSLPQLQTEEGPQLCNAVQVLAMEKVGDEAQAIRSNLVQEQRKESMLENAWEQARRETHGLTIEDCLLFHVERIEGKDNKRLVLPKACRQKVRALVHGMACGGHYSQKKTKQCIRSAFFWHTMVADVKKHCQTCHGRQVFSRVKTTNRDQ